MVVSLPVHFVGVGHASLPLLLFLFGLLLVVNLIVPFFLFLPRQLFSLLLKTDGTFELGLERFIDFVLLVHVFLQPLLSDLSDKLSLELRVDPDGRKLPLPLFLRPGGGAFGHPPDLPKLVGLFFEEVVVLVEFADPEPILPLLIVEEDAVVEVEEAEDNPEALLEDVGELG